jgi:hypothetical protein
VKLFTNSFSKNKCKILYILCILLLIFSYMFRRKCRPQRTYAIRRNMQEQINSKIYNIQSCAFFDAETACRLRLKCDGTRAESSFRLSAERESSFKMGSGSVQSTTGRRAVRISLQGLYCSREPVFCSHVTLTGYPRHSLVSSSLLLPCVTVCHHISKAVYIISI